MLCAAAPSLHSINQNVWFCYCSEDGKQEKCAHDWEVTTSDMLCIVVPSLCSINQNMGSCLHGKDREQEPYVHELRDLLP